MKLGIMGHGPIVHSFLEAASRVEPIRLCAIYNRPASADAGAALANQYHIPCTYQDFDAFLADKTVDTVYIALPNSLHYSYALRVLEAGKHAIVEKPFTVTTAQAAHLADTARAKGLFLFEAITVCHLPHVKKLRELLPCIGDLSLVQCNYSQYSKRYDQLMDGQMTNMFDPRFAGGSLMDLNSYNIHFAVFLFGEPASIQYFPRMGPRGVDTAGVAILQYASFTVSCAAAKDSESRCFAMVQGRQGCLYIDGPVNASPALALEIRHGRTERFSLQDRENRLIYELMEMERIVSHQDWEAHERLLSHSLAVARTLENARRSAGIRFLCDGEPLL